MGLNFGCFTSFKPKQGLYIRTFFPITKPGTNAIPGLVLTLIIISYMGYFSVNLKTPPPFYPPHTSPPYQSAIQG